MIYRLEYIRSCILADLVIYKRISGVSTSGWIEEARVLVCRRDINGLLLLENRVSGMVKYERIVLC